MARVASMSTQYDFVVGTTYSRKDVFKKLGISDPGGGNWYTGYNSHDRDWFVFCGVGTSGRTGHDYHNHFDGDDLVWFAKNRTRRGQPAIEGLLKPGGNVYIFYREDNRAPFTFAGIGVPKDVKNKTPVQVTWSFAAEAHRHAEILPQEIPNPGKVIEGAKKSITVNVYERDPSARHKCIARWGVACVVCSLEFGRVYGEIGAGFVHVHHLRPLSELGAEYELDPVQDLRPVCPNCHAMLHRKSPALTVDQLKSILQAQRP